MTTLNSTEYNRKFGAIFTPFVWAKKIVEKHFFDEWLRGATILDPTAGNGVFIEAFIALAKQKNIEITNALLSQLFGIELNKRFVDAFFDRMQTKYSIQFPKSNFRQGDILFQENEIVADYLVGNPPWVNFTDLDNEYKEKIKPCFLEYKMVANQKDLLLGNARTDIASLILLKVLHNNLKDNGKAIFFLPLSIFQNDGANQEFRNYKTKSVDFCVDNIMDFNGSKVFENVLGRYGIAQFYRNKKQTFPIQYHILSKGQWNIHKAKPLFNLTDPLTVFDNEETENKLSDFQKITLAKHLQPRQGVNTCGANDVFFFDYFKLGENGKVKLVNKHGNRVTVSAKYVFPLTMSSTLSKDSPQPEKMVLIPYKIDGKPLELSILQQEEELYNYLLLHKSILESRKGVMINSWINKGYWWAMLGVGEYSFKPYKIMWKAFGESVFTPKLLHPDSIFGSWQGNQSLNAFIGTTTFSEAEEVYEKLSNPLIQDYLSSLRMQGTCNWAQPGRMKKMINFV
jgi:hypothetical protein